MEIGGNPGTHPPTLLRVLLLTGVSRVPRAPGADAVPTGECCLALRSAIGTTARQFETFLFHRGEETGSVRGWMRVRVPRGRSGTRERLYGNGGRSQPPPGALGHPGPRFPLAPGRGVRPDLLPLQSGSALRRRMLSRRQSPRRAPSQPRSASGTPGGLGRAAAPDWGDAEPFPSLPFAGAAPAASRSQPPATPTLPTSSSRGCPTRGSRPPEKPPGSRERARPGGSAAGAPLDRGARYPQRRSRGVAGPAVGH